MAQVTSRIESAGGITKGPTSEPYPQNAGGVSEIFSENVITFTGVAGNDRTQTILDPATDTLKVFVNDVQIYPTP